MTALLLASELAYASCFFLTLSFLIYRNADVLESLLISFVTMFSGVILYEIVYHYGFGLGPLIGDLTTFDIQFVSSVHPQFPLLFASVVVCAPLLAWEYMSMNRPFLIVLSVSIALFFVWIIIGYPQFQNPSWWPTQKIIIWVFPKSYINAPTPEAQEAIESAGFWLNSFTKLLAVAPAFLFYPKKSQKVLL
jgi:hypothetical protein